jgi:hypothetical protein
MVAAQFLPFPMVVLSLILPCRVVPCCMLCCAVQGAVKDLTTVVSLLQGTPQQQQQHKSALAALQRRAAAATQQAVAEARRAQNQSRTVADSCVIEEVGDDPEEELQVRV